MKKYVVMSEMYSEIVPILDDGTGPTEEAYDYIEIEAENKADAKVLGIKLWKEEHKGKYEYWGGKDEDENIYKGTKVWEVKECESEKDL